MQISLIIGMDQMFIFIIMRNAHNGYLWITLFSKSNGNNTTYGDIYNSKELPI